MIQTVMPFHESAEQATDDAIRRSKKTHQQVAGMLRPELKIGSAYAWLKNALDSNPDHREKLSADQHITVANYCEEYDYVFYTCNQTHHTQPEKVHIEEEIMDLELQIIEGQGRIERQLVKLNSLKAASNG